MEWAIQSCADPLGSARSLLPMMYGGNRLEHVCSQHRTGHSWKSEYSECARNLITNGYSVLKISDCLRKQFGLMVSAFTGIDPRIKAVFSFPDRTDGFLPFGMERSSTTSRVDLCERFCFRQKYRLDHAIHPFSLSATYAAALACEALLSSIAEHLMDAISNEFDAINSFDIRDSSYLQFCSYSPQYRRMDREFLQDRHEDGNLITLVKATSDGLILYPKGSPMELSMAEDEIIAFTGSLLSILSDGRIPTMDHAVRNPSPNTARSSLVYFVLPDLRRAYRSFVHGKDIDLEPIANELHRGFGNHPFQGEKH